MLMSLFMLSLTDYETIDNDPEYSEITDVKESFKQAQHNVEALLQQPRIQRAKPNRYVKTRAQSPFIVPVDQVHLPVAPGRNESSTDNKPGSDLDSQAVSPAIYEYTITQTERDSCKKKKNLFKQNHITLAIIITTILILVVVGVSVFAAKTFIEKSGPEGKGTFCKMLGWNL